MRTVATTFLVLALLFGAIPAFAEMPDDYGTAQGSYCPKLSTTMQFGSRDIYTGGQVSELQRFLADYYDIEPLELVTGYFGRITQGYVQRFQREQALPSFGIAGSMSRAAIARLCSFNGAPVTGKSTTQNATGPAILVDRVSSKAVTGSFANLPSNSQIRFVNASTGIRYDGQSTMVSSGGSGALSIPIPNGLLKGRYYLRATDYYNPNTTIAESRQFDAGSETQTSSVRINSFKANSTSVRHGDVVTFTWSSNLTQNDVEYNSGGCSIEGITRNNVALQVTHGFAGANSQVSFAPPATATYTLTCTSGGKDGSPMATKQVTVSVGETQPSLVESQTDPVEINSFSVSSASIASGQPVTFSWDSNLTSRDRSYYGGSCGISAITSSNQQIHITNGAGARGSVTYAPSQTATYTLTCYSGGKDGSPSDTERVTVVVEKG